ncbi:MAG: hypothetical protein C4K58_05155 [Flavobacteriaceae bacterium]|nr:MAG: hypothetical protein C4K58_05155 [Flavobacteriaceae bacterium]
MIRFSTLKNKAKKLGLFLGLFASGASVFAQDNVIGSKLYPYCQEPDMYPTWLTSGNGRRLLKFQFLTENDPATAENDTGKRYLDEAGISSQNLTRDNAFLPRWEGDTFQEDQWRSTFLEDVTGDGISDLVLVTSDINTGTFSGDERWDNNVQVWIGDTTGSYHLSSVNTSFLDARDIEANAAGDPLIRTGASYLNYITEMEDVNGDGKADILVFMGNSTTPNNNLRVYTYLAMGGGHFSPYRAKKQSFTHTLNRPLGNPATTIPARIQFGRYSNRPFLGLGDTFDTDFFLKDYNGDGVKDVIATTWSYGGGGYGCGFFGCAASYESALVVWFGKTDGSGEFNTVADVQQITSTDLPTQTDAQGFQTPPPYNTNRAYTGWARTDITTSFEDFDSDGDLDYIVVDETSDTFRVFKNNGKDTSTPEKAAHPFRIDFINPVITPLPAHAGGTITANEFSGTGEGEEGFFEDFNKDGYIDYMYVRQDSGSKVYFNKTGLAGTTGDYTIETSPTATTLAPKHTPRPTDPALQADFQIGRGIVGILDGTYHRTLQAGCERVDRGDADGDTVKNFVDLDDDNDGILDEVEGLLGASECGFTQVLKDPNFESYKGQCNPEYLFCLGGYAENSLYWTSGTQLDANGNTFDPTPESNMNEFRLGTRSGQNRIAIYDTSTSPALQCPSGIPRTDINNDKYEYYQAELIDKPGDIRRFSFDIHTDYATQVLNPAVDQLQTFDMMINGTVYATIKVNFNTKNPLDANRSALVEYEIIPQNGASQTYKGTASYDSYKFVIPSYDVLIFANPAYDRGTTIDITLPGVITPEKFMIRTTFGCSVDNNTAFDNFKFYDKESCSDTPSSVNIDADALPNHLDNDSDADGCPDALEGTTNFVKDDLDANTRLKITTGFYPVDIPSTDGSVVADSRLGLPRYRNFITFANPNQPTLAEVATLNEQIARHYTPQGIGTSYDDTKKSGCGECSLPGKSGTAEQTLGVSMSTLNRNAHKDAANTDKWPYNEVNSQLTLESTVKGLVIPRTTSASIPTNVANEGMIIYDTTDNCIKMFDGTTWSCLIQDCTYEL